LIEDSPEHAVTRHDPSRAVVENSGMTHLLDVTCRNPSAISSARTATAATTAAVIAYRRMLLSFKAETSLTPERGIVWTKTAPIIAKPKLTNSAELRMYLEVCRIRTRAVRVWKGVYHRVTEELGGDPYIVLKVSE